MEQQNTPATTQGGTRRTNWITQGLIQLAIIQIVIHLFKQGRTPTQQVSKVGPSYTNFLGQNDVYDIFIYSTKNASTSVHKLGTDDLLLWSRENQIYDHKFNQPYEATTLQVDYPAEWASVGDNELFYAVFLVPHKSYAEKKVPFYKSNFKPGFDGHVMHKTIPMTTIRRSSKKSKEVNLLSMGRGDAEDFNDGDFKTKKYWVPRLDVNIVHDTMVYTNDPGMTFFGEYVSYSTFGSYDPLIFLSQFWVLEDQFVPIEGHEGPFDVVINFSTCSPTYFAFSHQLIANSNSGGLLGAQTSKEVELLKKTLMTTHLYMLVFSACFIALHSIFSFFALKSDIQFWYKNESMEGLSALSIVINFFCDVVVALYIFDSDNTSWLVIFEICLGVVASAWKVSKAVKFGLTKSFPFITFNSANKYVESSTKKYDEIAIKYMSIALAPCVVGYAIYSLYYEKHKSWYSYFLSVAAGSVYTFGFIMMTPQVYINYKLKSVDHLPWRSLVYKTLNTFVDDVASFLIEMPWMHRLSCFRDDIIFFCYLYQLWAYRKRDDRTQYWTKSLTEEEKLEEKVLMVGNAPAQSDEKNIRKRK